jgi:hypothetical protein
MRDGTFAGAVVEVHPDPRVQGLIEQMRECESAQAIARLRPLHRDNPIPVIVLSNVVLDQTVDHLVKWREIVPGSAEKARILTYVRGVLPLVPRWLKENNLEFLLTDELAWAKTQDFRQGRFGISQIEILFGIFRTVPLELSKNSRLPIISSFTIGHKGGSRSCALVRPDLADPEAAVAAALGKPIHGFRIEGAEHAQEFATGGTGDRTAECDAAPLDDQPYLRPLEQALVKSGGVLPLSGKWLSETQPDLFGSRATAERAVSEFWAALENGEEWATVVADNHALANYKLKSGPGRPAHAIMCKDFAASADALQFVLGCEVHGFSVIPWGNEEVDAPSPEDDLPDASAPIAPWGTFPLRLDPKRMIKRVLDGVIGKPPADLSAEGLEVVGSIYQGSAERIIMEIGYVADEYPEYLTPTPAELLNLTPRP